MFFFDPTYLLKVDRQTRRQGQRRGLKQDDEWTVADRRYFSAESMRQLTQPLPPTTMQEWLTAIA